MRILGPSSIDEVVWMLLATHFDGAARAARRHFDQRVHLLERPSFTSQPENATRWFAWMSGRLQESADDIRSNLRAMTPDRVTKTLLQRFPNPIEPVIIASHFNNVPVQVDLVALDAADVANAVNVNNGQPYHQLVSAHLSGASVRGVAVGAAERIYNSIRRSFPRPPSRPPRASVIPGDLSRPLLFEGALHRTVFRQQVTQAGVAFVVVDGNHRIFALEMLSQRFRFPQDTVEALLIT